MARRLLDRTCSPTRPRCEESVEDRIHREAAQVAFFAILVRPARAAAGRPRSGWRSMTPTCASGSSDGVRQRPAVQGCRPRAARADGRGLPRRRGQPRPDLASSLLIVAASGVMGAIRHTINEAWDIEARPPLLRRKALDLALVLGGDAPPLVAVRDRHQPGRGRRRRGGRGWSRSRSTPSATRCRSSSPPLVILFLYCVLPMQRQRPRAVAGRGRPVPRIALLLEGLELYFEHLSDFGALYGSLGGATALLLFVYAAANVLVFGAEFASEWARLPGATTRRWAAKSGSSGVGSCGGDRASRARRASRAARRDRSAGGRGSRTPARGRRRARRGRGRRARRSAGPRHGTASSTRAVRRCPGCTSTCRPADPGRRRWRSAGAAARTRSHRRQSPRSRIVTNPSRGPMARNAPSGT